MTAVLPLRGQRWAPAKKISGATGPARIARWLLVTALLVCEGPGVAAAQEESMVAVQGTAILDAKDLARACDQAAQLVGDGTSADA